MTTESHITPAERFALVPVARRRDGWTPERQRAFIAALARCGLVGAAAGAVGMTARSAYRLRGRPGAESFAAAWDEALDDGLFHARLEAFGRAVDGEDVPVFYRGRQVGTRRRHNDRLLIAALRVMGGRSGRAVPDNGSSHSAEDVMRLSRRSGPAGPTTAATALAEAIARLQPTLDDPSRTP